MDVNGSCSLLFDFEYAACGMKFRCYGIALFRFLRVWYHSDQPDGGIFDDEIIWSNDSGASEPNPIRSGEDISRLGSFRSGSTMSAQAARLARLFTPEYARRINAQMVHPAQSVVVKPNELESALTRPLHVAVYEPDRPAAYLAATLSYGIIKGISLCTYIVCFCLPIPRTSVPGR